MEDLEGSVQRLLEERRRQIANGSFDPTQLPSGIRPHKKVAAPVIEDPSLCDNPDCSNVTKTQCSRCKIRLFCCRECQLAAWSAYHKGECSSLQLCKRTSQISSDFTVVQEEYATSMGVIATKEHGTHFYVMEKYQVYGSESNRAVVLASTQDLSIKGITSCIMDSILFPEFDTDMAGRRRPYYVEIFKHTFPDEGVVDSVCVLLVRLGITIKALEDFHEGHKWNSSWFFVQNGWNEEITDELFLAMIEEDRRRPLEPNGMARKSVAASVPDQKTIPRLKPNDFPTRKKALKFPYSKNESQQFWVLCKDGILRILLWDAARHGASVLLRQQVQLQQRTGRPYHDDVMLLIYKAITLHKERPTQILLGQPSVCVLADVRKYEKSLDYAICKEQMRLAKKDSLERNWEGMAREGAT